MSIKEEIDELNKQKKMIELTILAIKDRCKHELFTKEACSDTGNWCSGDDKYWYQFECQDCGHRWTRDQNEYNNEERAKRRNTPKDDSPVF